MVKLWDARMLGAGGAPRDLAQAETRARITCLVASLPGRAALAAGQPAGGAAASTKKKRVDKAAVAAAPAGEAGGARGQGGKQPADNTRQPKRPAPKPAAGEVGGMAV